MKDPAIDVLVGLPMGEEGEDVESEEAPAKAEKPDQEAIINDIRALLDKLAPAVSSMG